MSDVIITVNSNVNHTARIIIISVISILSPYRTLVHNHTFWMKKMGICSVCENEANYKCIICLKFICNRSLDCHVPVKEGTLAGWLMGEKVAVCQQCNESRRVLEVDNKVDVDSEKLMTFEVNCASREFHVFWTSWKPTDGEYLRIEREYGNVHDPFSISIRASSRGNVTSSNIVGHLPREISHFCHIYLNYGGALEGLVRDRKYQRSPIPKGGLEITIVLIIKKENAPTSVFNCMIGFVKEYYIEPEQISVSSAQSEAEERMANNDLEEFVPGETNGFKVGEENILSDQGERDIIVVED